MGMPIVVVHDPPGGEAGGDDEYRKHGAAIAPSALNHVELRSLQKP